MIIQGVAYPSDFEAKKAIIAAAARLEAKGFLTAGDGSLSVRVGPNAVWITVEGADKACLQQDQLVRIDLNGKQMASNNPRPLGEDLPIHLRIYRENDSVQGIVHTYPACAAVLNIQGRGLEAASYSPSVRKMGRIQLLAGDAETVAAASRTDRGALLRNDGFLSWGRSLAEAAQTAETLDYSCKVSKCTQKAGERSCSGHGNCCGSSTAAGPAAFSEPVPAPAAVLPPVQPAQPVSPVGVTGLIRPGEALPILPPVSGGQASPAPVVPAPTAPAAAAPTATEVPRADVMAEVVRRVMGQTL